MTVRSSSNAMVNFEDLKFRDCYVNQVGPIENGATIVMLTETSGEFSEVWFSAYDPIAQQVLQTALVAVQNSLVCNVALTDTKADSEIYRIQVTAGRVRQ
jgi:hypothetical protein